MDSSVKSMMHAVRCYFRFAHSHRSITPTRPATQRDCRRSTVKSPEPTGLTASQLIRFLQVVQAITVHHGALAYILGINAPRASEAAVVRIEDYADTLPSHRVLHLVGKGNKPATMSVTVPVLRASSLPRPTNVGAAGAAAALGQARRRRRRVPDGRSNREDGQDPPPISPHLLRHAAITKHPRRRRPSLRRADPRPDTPTHAPPSTTIAPPGATSTDTASSSHPVPRGV
jgi:hypothetical protein